jgi:uncharacterized protein (TIGR03086 family)
MTTESTATRETPGQLYARAMESTQRHVAAVREDQWTAVTPCREWNVRDIVNHVVSENLWAAELFRGKTIQAVGNRLDGDLVGDDPIGAYTRSVASAKPAVEAPGAMEATCHLSYGDETGAEYARQLFMDILIHGWDIAKATGQDTGLDPDLVADCLPIAERLTAKWRSAGIFGEKLEVAPDADRQTKLLALAGRTA